MMLWHQSPVVHHVWLAIERQYLNVYTSTFIHTCIAVMPVYILYTVQIYIEILPVVTHKGIKLHKASDHYSFTMKNVVDFKGGIGKQLSACRSSAKCSQTGKYTSPLSTLDTSRDSIF